MEIGRGRNRRQVTAKYSSKKGTTEFTVYRGDKLVGDGLQLMCMVTIDGDLDILLPDGLTPKGKGGSDKSDKSSKKSSKGSSKSNKSSKE